jgi:hypothetical protein
MAVTAKVKLTNKQPYGNGSTLTFEPDYQDGRNRAWAEATPNLHLVTTWLGDVAEQFEVGDAVTLTFEKSGSEAQGEQD